MQTMDNKMSSLMLKLQPMQFQTHTQEPQPQYQPVTQTQFTLPQATPLLQHVHSQQQNRLHYLKPQPLMSLAPQVTPQMVMSHQLQPYQPMLLTPMQSA